MALLLMTIAIVSQNGNMYEEGYSLDYYYVNLPGRAEMQNDLILDYRSKMSRRSLQQPGCLATDTILIKRKLCRRSWRRGCLVW